MVETGDIPQHALARLEGLRREGHPDGVFTSDFSVNEFLLVRKAGFEPIGLCVGSCIYHVGFQFAGWSSSVETTLWAISSSVVSSCVRSWTRRSNSR